MKINIRRRNASYRHIMAAAGQSNGHGNQTRTPQSIATAASIASRDAARSTFTLSRPTNKSAKSRLQKELADITLNPPPHCSAGPKGDNLYEWVSTVHGPPGSLYDGGIFFMDIQFPSDYPFKPPKVIFRTRIYHCNINNYGQVCLDILTNSWSPAMTISKVLTSVCVLLTCCNLNDPLVTTIAEKFKTERHEHDRLARVWTKRYAT